MTKREIELEKYLWRRVAETGGEHRKVVWLGRRGAPDDVAGWPNGRHAFVEVKEETQGWGLRPHQAREHARMRSWGMDVRVLWNREQVDAFITEMTS